MSSGFTQITVNLLTQRLPEVGGQAANFRASEKGRVRMSTSFALAHTSPAVWKAALAWRSCLAHRRRLRMIITPTWMNPASARVGVADTVAAHNKA